MKRCAKCHSEKPLDEFHRLRGTLTSGYPRSRDGHHQRCKDCVRADNARYRAKRLAYNERYHIENRDVILARKRAQHDPAYASARFRRWRTENPEKAKVRIARRRARELGAAGEATPEQIAARVAFYGGLCWLCGASYEAIDHVIPLARGGSHWPSNLRPVCNPCNWSKGARMPWELVAA